MRMFSRRNRRAPRACQKAPHSDTPTPERLMKALHGLRLCLLLDNVLWRDCFKWPHNIVIMLWAWMLWLSYALGARTELCIGHGYSGHHMLLEHERNHASGMDTLVTDHMFANDFRKTSRLHQAITLTSGERWLQLHESTPTLLLLAITTTTPHHATPRHTTPHHATPRHTTPHHATPCHATPHHYNTTTTPPDDEDRITTCYSLFTLAITTTSFNCVFYHCCTMYTSISGN